MINLNKIYFLLSPILLLSNLALAQEVQQWSPHLKFREADIQSSKKAIGQQSASAGAYTPQQIKQAYGITSSIGDGQGATIAIIDAYGSPTIEADLNTFSQKFSLPDTSSFSFSILKPDGEPNLKDPLANAWSGETTLDVEWAHAIAPKARIILVLAKAQSVAYLADAVDAAVRANPTVVTMSFGGPEPTSAAEAAALDQHFAFPNIIFVASSGDSGAGVIYPASSPYVVSVGGTTLHLDAAGNLTSPEAAWSGSGGGVSAIEAVPSYQTKAQNTKMRSVPDVSYNADPNTGYLIYITNPLKTGKTSVSGWVTGAGGTSAAAPQWAALLAIASVKRAGKSGSIQESLYSLYQKSPATYFRDILQGSDGKAVIDQAHSGYDYVTGLGTPIASGLIPALGSF